MGLKLFHEALHYRRGHMPTSNNLYSRLNDCIFGRVVYGTLHCLALLLDHLLKLT